MQQRIVDYYDGQDLLRGILIYPDDNTQQEKAAVILFHPFEGRGTFTLEYGERLAKNGYIVFVADMYGNATTSDTISGCFELITPFLQDRQLVRRRAVLAYEILLQQDGVNSDRVGAMGFCFGGMCMLELARSGVKLKAGVSAHGVLAKSDLVTHQIKSSLLILHGYKDPQVPPELLTVFAAEMEAARTDDWTFTFFGDAKHSFTDPKTGTFDMVKEQEMGREYNALAAARTYKHAVDFFNEQLLDI